MTIQDVISSRDYRKLYILCRYFYRIGEPISGDKFYDELDRTLREKSAFFPDLQEYFDRTYDDDPIPYDLLAQMGVQAIDMPDLQVTCSLARYLDEEKSNSIKSVTSYEETYEYLMLFVASKLDFMVSLKTDGLNTKMLYENGKFALSLSRGRHGNGIDYTENSAKIMPTMVSTEQEHLKVTGESYVVEEALPLLRDMYDENKYKTCKSSAQSMLRVAHEREHYKYLKTLVFMAEGLAPTLDKMFLQLEAGGFNTVPHRLFRWQEIPTIRDEFDIWLKSELLDYIWERGIGIPSDGIVVEVNDLSYEGLQHNQYNTRQLALKFEQWQYKISSGIIRDIVIEQKRVYKSVRIAIDPIVTYDGCKAEYINSFNPSILIHNDLFIGKKIYFERNSGAVNILLHGRKLDGFLNKKGSE